MELIKELGLTVMVGVFSILGVEVMMHYFFNRPFTGFFQEILKKREMLQDGTSEPPTESGVDNTATVVLFVALAFTVGIVAEDLSFKYDNELPFRTIPAMITRGHFVQKLGLPTEDDDLVASLIGSMKHPKPNPLATDLAHSNALRISDQPQIGEKVQNWIKTANRCIPGSQEGDCPSPREVESAFKNLFYFAKNTAYSNEYHYDELRKIQSRLEFMRSLSMIAFLYFGVGLVLWVVLSFKRWLWDGRKGTGSVAVYKVRAKVPVVLTVLFLVYFLSLWAYSRETDAFNRRAFGYLSTSLIEERRQTEAKLQEQPQPQRSPTLETETSRLNHRPK